MGKRKVIESPNYILKSLKNFPLSKLEQTFTIAEFERPLKLRHISKLVSAMAANEFFNNILSVIQKNNGKFEIIDGQHRIEAFKEIRDVYEIKKYDLILLIFPEKFSRKIYRRINLGQPLKMQDHLRALDNGHQQFFIKLRPYFVHYNDGTLPKFQMILSALSYAKNGSPRAVRPLLLDRLFKNILLKDLEIIIKFSNALADIEPHIPKKFQALYSYGIYRNMFRVGYENRFDQNTWQNFISICRVDRELEKLYKIRTMTSMRLTYSHMIDQIGPQMGLKLKRIERTNMEIKKVLATPTVSHEAAASPIFFQE